MALSPADDISQGAGAPPSERMKTYSGQLRVAAVGHVEWADVLRVERVPAAGEWIESSALRSEPAGAGATAARQLANLAGKAAFFTVLTEDNLSQRTQDRLEEIGVEVFAASPASAAQRRAFVVVDDDAERTILIHGPKLCPRGKDDIPWAMLGDYDGVCFVCGDAAALVEARRARVLVATARWLPVLQEAGIQLDALVRSATDPDERYVHGDLDPPPALVVTTAGAAGGTYALAGHPECRFPAAPLSARAVDSYGAGDSFLAGLTFGLARGDAPADALALAARCGAAVVEGHGISTQLDNASGSVTR